MARRGQLLNAGVFATLGVLILVASWRMDRLTDRGIEAWSVPGLMPGMVGALMIVLALVLAWQAWRTIEGPGAQVEPVVPGATARTLAAIALCGLFAGLTLGHGLPFVVEGAVFIFVFTTLFSWRQWRAEQRTGRGLLQTLVVAVAASAGISWLFESVFLVRLP